MQEKRKKYTRKLNAICDEWLENKLDMVKNSTYFNYKFKIEKYIKPLLGKYKPQDLSSNLLNHLIKEKMYYYKRNTIKGVLVVLKSILEYAKKNYNVSIGIQTNLKINDNSHETEIFKDLEIRKIVNRIIVSKDVKLLGILISLYEGLRIGEVCGLKWKDIDMANQLIEVNRTVQRVYYGKNKSKVIVSMPKSFHSIRRIPIAKVIGEVLKSFYQSDLRDCYILTKKKEKPMEPIVYRYTYKKFLKECQIPYKKYHALRHTFATKCIEVGMDVKSLSELLGHANVNITLNTYVHSSYKIKKKFIDRL